MTRNQLLAKTYKSEDAFQADFVRFWNTQHYCLKAILFHVPNQATYQNSKYLAMGVLAGIPDLIILMPNSQTLLVELKLPNGSLSPAQKRVHKALQATQHVYAVVYTPTQLFEFLDPFLCVLDTMPKWNPICPSELMD
jgi:hypothetical protein